jgi:5'(3')-deoxyribonucleotidase
MLELWKEVVPQLKEKEKHGGNKMTQRKKIVAVDMDDTILWLMKAIHADHAKKHPDFPVAYEDMIAFDDSMLHPDYCKLSFFKEPGTFLNLEIMDDYVVKELEAINKDYDLIIVTSSFAENVDEKWQWMQKYLPFVPHRNFCAFSRKDLIQADILIDDAIHNVVDWVETGRPAIVPSHHWNQELAKLDGVTMIYGWHGMKEILDDILSPLEV